MKLVAVADLHYTPARRARLSALASAMCHAGADALLFAGDFVGGAADRLEEALALFAEYTGPKLMVAGNHDLWQQHPPFATWTRYQQTIAAAAREHGFHYLDEEPLVIGKVGFVGSIGWYDYSFRHLAEPRAGVRATPIRVAGSAGGGPRFVAVAGAQAVSWSELTSEDYRHKGLVWQADGAPHVATWSDAAHLDWQRSDRDMAEHFARRMATQLEQVAGVARRVVAVTHFVPFPEFVGPDIPDVTRAFARAYLGSPLMGQVLGECEQLAAVVFGHRHRQEVRQVNGVLAVDASIARPGENPLVLTLPD